MLANCHGTENKPLNKEETVKEKNSGEETERSLPETVWAVGRFSPHGWELSEGTFAY